MPRGNERLSRFAARVEPSVARVEAHSTREIEVTLTIRDPQNLPDALTDDAGGLSAISGVLVATPRSSSAGVYTLRSPIMLVPYGLSDIQARAVRLGERSVSGIRVANRGVHGGTADTYQWIGTDRSGDVASALVPDLRDLGVQTFPIAPGLDLAVFSISLYNTVATHPTNEYDLVLDTDRDGNADYYVITVDYGLLTSGSPDGTLASFVFDASFNVVDVLSATAPANGSTVEVPVILQDIGSPSGAVAIEVDGWTVLSDLAPDVMTASFTPSHMTVSNGDYVGLAPGSNAVVPVTVDRAAATAQGTLGWLVVSLDDAAGTSEVDRVPLRGD